MTGNSKSILLTGATGYVGGRLLPRLLESGHRVRCLTRRPEKLAGVAGAEAVKGDVLDPVSLPAALSGVDTAYYLVHSMEAGAAFEEKDRQGAKNFGEAAKAAGVKRIIYLGGLAHGDNLSPHLSSRLETGRILRDSGVPLIEFRASVIIGCGSLSFEMVKALVERLPVMTTPKWVSTPAQPIYIDDVLDYLAAALTIEAEGGRVFEIGGADRVAYLDIMREYARATGRRRLFFKVPVLTPWLSSLWLGLVTPLHARVGRKLIEGVKNDSTVRDHAADEAFSIKPRGLSEAISLSMCG